MEVELRDTLDRPTMEGLKQAWGNCGPGAKRGPLRFLLRLNSKKPH